MADLANFRQYLADKAASEGGLAQVCLKTSTDFDIDLARIVTVDNRQDEETDSQVASRYVDEICDSLAQPENAGIVKKIGEVIECFKDKILAAINAIKDIRANAHKLAEFMDKATTDYLAKDPFVSTHLNLTKLSVDFPVWEWGGPKLIGGSDYIKERVGGMITAKDAEVPTSFDYRLFINGCQAIDSKVKIEPCELDEAANTQLTDNLVNALSELVTKDDVTKVLNVITGSVNLRGEISQIKNLSTMDPGELFETIKEYDAFIRTFYPVADAIDGGQVTLPEGDVQEILVSNSRAVKTLCEFMAYFELMERETVFSHAILLQGGLLNIDEKEAFTSAGGTELMLAHYIRFMYKDNVKSIPARGISSNVIIESAAQTEKVVKADISNITNRIAVATTKARVAAFNVVAHNYLASKVDREHPDDPQLKKATIVDDYEQTIGSKIASRILHHDIAFVDAALMLIVEADYNGTFVEQMYNQLGTAYLAKAKDAEGSVSDLDLKVAEMAVVARMVSDFVVEHLVEACPGDKDMTIKAPVVPENAE